MRKLWDWGELALRGVGKAATVGCVDAEPRKEIMTCGALATMDTAGIIG